MCITSCLSGEVVFTWRKGCRMNRHPTQYFQYNTFYQLHTSKQLKEWFTPPTHYVSYNKRSIKTMAWFVNIFVVLSCTAYTNKPQPHHRRWYPSIDSDTKRLWAQALSDCVWCPRNSKAADCRIHRREEVSSTLFLSPTPADCWFELVYSSHFI
jgi:hypothetical protein